MAYGTIKVDTITFTDAGVDKSITVSGLVQNPTFSGNLTVSGTISGNAIQGQTVSGATITGGSAAFTTVTGGVATITSGVFALGSASNPSISFTGDANTGLYSPGADQVAISTNSVGRVFVDASGRLGVGVSSPGHALDVLSVTSGTVAARFRGNDSATNNTQIRFYGANAATDQWAIGNAIDSNDASRNFDIYDNVAFANRLRIDSSGRVGIGTSSPGSLLTLGTNTPRLEFNDGDSATDNKRWQFVTGATSFTIRGLTDAGAAGGNTFSFNRSNENVNSFQASASGTPWFFVDNSTQRVGIGTTSPRYNLSLGSTAITSTASPDTIDLGGTFSNTAGANLKLRLYWDGTTPQGFGISAFQMDYVAASNAAHVFYRGTSEAARIDASSRLLVGTSSALTNVLIKGDLGSSAATTPQEQFALATNSYNAGLSITNYSASGYGGVLSLNSSKSNTLGANALVDNTIAVGTLSFNGNDGTNFVPCAEIKAAVDGTPGANDMPGRLVFSTTADGESSPTERMRIAQNGVITIQNGAVAVIGTLTDGATITPDFAADCNFTVTLGGSRTIANPTNITAGQSGSIFIVQDATGSRTLSWGSYWDFPGGTAPTLSTAANAVDRVDYIVRSSTSIHTVFTANYS